MSSCYFALVGVSVALVTVGWRSVRYARLDSPDGDWLSHFENHEDLNTQEFTVRRSCIRWHPLD